MFWPGGVTLVNIECHHTAICKSIWSTLGVTWFPALDMVPRIILNNIQEWKNYSKTFLKYQRFLVLSPQKLLFYYFKSVEYIFILVPEKVCYCVFLFLSSGACSTPSGGSEKFSKD